MSFDLKSIVVGAVIGTVGLSTVYGAGRLKNIDVIYGISNISVQNEKINFPDGREPFNYNDTTYVPLREFSDAMGCYVSYNEGSINVNSTDKVKIKLLKDAINEFGASTPEKTIEIWSKGLSERNAAIQYSVMTEGLKETYSKQLAENEYDNWVTGVSSPWVDSYEILNTTEEDNGSCKYGIKYITKTSDGDYNFNVSLTLIKEGDYWKITKVDGDEESTIYTGFSK